ncbi:MAG TPA: hypothetical protein V6C81_08110 [Planktothrix sp.]
MDHQGKDSSCATSGCPVTAFFNRVNAFFTRFIPFLRKRAEKDAAQSLMNKMNDAASPSCGGGCAEHHHPTEREVERH